MSPVHVAPSGDRLLGVDLARSVAIAAALAAHAQVAFLERYVGIADTPISLLLFMRLGTPSFVFLFGFLLEMVHARALAAGRQEETAVRLHVRALQCYLCYALTCLSALVGGQLDVKEFLLALALLTNGRFGNILKFYAVACLLAPWVLRWRVRHGNRVLVLLLATLWMLHGLAKQVPLPALVRESWTAMTFLGTALSVGTMGYSPSWIDAATFLVAGMLVAQGVAPPQPLGPAARAWPIALVTATALAVVAALAPGYPGPVLPAFADFRLRTADHPLYFAIGTLGTLLVVSASLLVARLVPAGLAVALGAPGRMSLAAFTAGNVLLNLWPRPSGLRAALVMVACFTLVLAGVLALLRVAPPPPGSGGWRRLLAGPARGTASVTLALRDLVQRVHRRLPRRAGALEPGG